MTKENFIKYDKTLDVYCETCLTYKPVSSFSYGRIRTNQRTASICKVCDWFKRNEKMLKNISYDLDLIKIIVSFFIEKKGEYIEDLMNVTLLSFEETYNIIKLLGLDNQHLLTKCTCSYCGKNFDSTIATRLKNTNVYCSNECYWLDKINTSQKGIDSQYYNRIETFCTNCNKPIKIIPSKYNSTNSFGDNHNFCSKECYWHYRSKYYIGNKCSMTNYEYSDEERERQRINLLNRMNSENRLNTKIQLIVNDILDKLKISYTREKLFDYYSVDNYLENNNLIIEVMGDYWHVNPFRYNEDKYKINEMQQKQLHRDKLKYSYINNHYQLPILYLWETDILKYPNKCIKIITEYINNNGVLINYHSFNYELLDDSLFLCTNIITPYQDMKIDKYRNLIKKAG